VSNPGILVIEDDPLVRHAVRTALASLPNQLLEAGTGADGIRLAVAQEPALVILDLGLPDAQGIEICQELRARTGAPIIVLSARRAEEEKVALLNAGADDYITKPFSPPELLARAQAHLRRGKTVAQANGVLTVGGLTIDFADRRISRAGKPIHLTPTEWEILRALAAEAGRTVPHQRIFDVVWGRPFGHPQQYLRVYLTNLRRKIEVDPTRPTLIVTEPGVGYRFNGEE